MLDVVLLTEFEDELLPVSAETVTGVPVMLTEHRARLWSLVLESQSIPGRLVHDQGNWLIYVSPDNYDRAVEQLRLFVAENRNWPPPLPEPHSLIENTLSTLSILVLIAVFHNITRLDVTFPGQISTDWMDLGCVDVAKVFAGEWWRLLTALTLHANEAHLFSNLVIGGIVAVNLCRDLGSGLSWCLIVGSGVFGNLLNCILQPPDHRSVGASTAVFGTIGIFTAVSMLRSRSHFLKQKLLLPMAAAASLLVMLGTEGVETDLGAHLFGLASGMALGLAAESLVMRFGRPGWKLNAVLDIACILMVIVSWRAAIQAYST